MWSSSNVTRMCSKVVWCMELSGAMDVHRTKVHSGSAMVLGSSGTVAMMDAISDAGEAILLDWRQYQKICVKYESLK